MGASMTEPAPFLRNAWYMAGWSAEIGNALLRRRLLGVPLLLFRKMDGNVAALIDRCPHRFAPLSLGERDGDCVTCPYHGLTFDADGRCVRNPFADTLPKGAKVRSFPVAERDGIIWFWPGQRELADEGMARTSGT
jgi:vanillate O-demethylase monooxygenase subunit